MLHLTSLAEVFDRYDAFLCDLWGVIHDGEYLYPGVLETLERLHDADKQVYFLSNAPRTANSVIQKMKQMGVRREWYLDALTSGEAARRYLMDHPKWVVEGNQFLLGNYYYQGLEVDTAILDGLPQQRVHALSEAAFILNGNFDYHGQPLAELLPKLGQAAAQGLPMLCINPDLEVVKQDGTQILCAGYLAREYEKLGGKVGYIGKPYPLIYEMAMEALFIYLQTEQVRGAKRRGERSDGGVSPPQKQRIAMIGDNLHTDIKGGKAAGTATILVTQGVYRENSLDMDPQPDYVISSFS